MSTQERVVKDVRPPSRLSPPPPASPSKSADNPPSFALPTQVQAPAHALPTDEQFYMDGDRTKPDIAFLKNHFYREGRLTEEQALFILRKSVPNPPLSASSLTLTSSYRQL